MKHRIILVAAIVAIAAAVAGSAGVTPADASCLAPVTGDSTSGPPGCVAPGIYGFDSGGVLNVSYGSSVTIYYNFDEAPSGCTVTGTSGGSVIWTYNIDTTSNPYGHFMDHVQTPGLTVTTTFGMQCNAPPAGSTKATPFTVNVNPAVCTNGADNPPACDHFPQPTYPAPQITTYSLSRPTVLYQAGMTANLTLDTKYATACYGRTMNDPTSSWKGSVGLATTFTVGPFGPGNRTIQYDVICDGPSGSSPWKSVVLTVVDDPTTTDGGLVGYTSNELESPDWVFLSQGFFICNPGDKYKGKYAAVVFKNLVGVWLWKMVMEIRWCYNGNKITRIQRDRYPEIDNLNGLLPTPWEFKGWNGFGGCAKENCSDLAGTGVAVMSTSGQFHFCSAKWFLCSNHTPFIQMAISAQGDFSVLKWTG